MKLDRHSVWPISIIISLILITILLSILLFLSKTSHPVNMDMRFMQGYQQVDKNYDTIVAGQEEFFASFDTKIITNNHSKEPIEVPHFRHGSVFYDHAFTMGKNRFYMSLTDKNGNPIDSAAISAGIERLNTDRFNQKVDVKYNSDRKQYEFGPFEITQEGRFGIAIKVDIDGKIGFLEKDVYAK